LRSRCFSGRRSAAARACSRKTAWAWSTKSGTCAKSGTAAWGARSARTCEACACRMLRTRACARELARSARCALLESAGSACGPPVKDWFAALNASTLWRRRSRGCSGHRWRLVYRTRSGLRHHHTPRRRGRGCRRRLWSPRLWCARSNGSRSNGLRRCFLDRRNWRSCRWCRRRCSRCSDLWLFRCRRSRRDRSRRSGFRRYRHRLRCCGCLFRGCRFGLRRLRGRYDYGRSYHHVLWRNHRHDWTRSYCSSRGLGDNGPGRGPRSDGRSRRRDNCGCRPGLRNDFARLWTRGSSRRCCGSRRCRCGRFRRSHCNNGCCRLARRYQALASFCLLFLLFGQNGLHHVPGLGNVGKIDFRSNRLGCARRRTVTGGARSMLELRANLVSFVVFDRTRVCLAFTQTEFREHIEDLPALDFQLAREIVNSNLAHPPLFRMCCPKPLVAHSYLMALEVCVTTIIA